MSNIKRVAVYSLCCGVLGVALNACSPSVEIHGQTHGSVTVIFDKNGGDTEAVPTSKTVTTPTATTFGRLPTPPGRAGHAFLGWNTERNGKGSPFTAETTVDAGFEELTFVVYAQWEPLPPGALPLSIQFVPGAPTLTPLDGERSATFTVSVAGFENNADASNLKLDINSVRGLTFSNITPLQGGKAFTVTVDYNGEQEFSSGFAAVQINLSNLPEGYAYAGPQTIHLPLADGQREATPIPVNQNNIQAFNNYVNTPHGLTRHYKLTGDVKLDGNWKMIGTPDTLFTGSFDGGNNTISDLSSGLFNVTGPSAVIKNLRLTDVNIYDSSGQVGGVVGQNKGMVENCHVTGNVNVTGSWSVGGVVGENNGTVQNCSVTGNASVLGDDSVGGVVGANNGFVRNCHATSKVSFDSKSEKSIRNGHGGVVGFSEGGMIENCYATGTVRGNIVVGGVLGNNNGTVVQNCYATGNISGNNAVGGVVGYSHKNDTVQKCVALNPSVKAYTNTTAIWRVSGGTQPNNYARSDMVIRYNVNADGSGGTDKDISKTAIVGKEDGESVPARDYNLRSFWDEFLDWNFSTVWEWDSTNKLPTLRKVGGAQNPTVK